MKKTMFAQIDEEQRMDKAMTFVGIIRSLRASRREYGGIPLVAGDDSVAAALREVFDRDEIEILCKELLK